MCAFGRLCDEFLALCQRMKQREQTMHTNVNSTFRGRTVFPKRSPFKQTSTCMRLMSIVFNLAPQRLPPMATCSRHHRTREVREVAKDRPNDPQVPSEDLRDGWMCDNRRRNTRSIMRPFRNMALLSWGPVSNSSRKRSMSTEPYDTTSQLASAGDVCCQSCSGIVCQRGDARARAARRQGLDNWSAHRRSMCFSPMANEGSHGTPDHQSGRSVVYASTCCAISRANDKPKTPNAARTKDLCGGGAENSKTMGRGGFRPAWATPT